MVEKPSSLGRHCYRKNGTYYFYFSAGNSAKNKVATTIHPSKPFTDALYKPLISENSHDTQPFYAHAFTDDDGQSYLFYGGWNRAIVVKIDEDMFSIVGDFSNHPL